MWLKSISTLFIGFSKKKNYLHKVRYMAEPHAFLHEISAYIYIYID